MKPEHAKVYARPNLDEVLADYMHRLDQGELVDHEALIKAHPELSDELREYFSHAAAVGLHSPMCDVTATFTGQVTPGRYRPTSCPNCHKPVEIETDVRPAELTCSSCGKRFTDHQRNAAVLPVCEVERAEDDAAQVEIGRYVVEGRLGQGGFGSVYLCQDPLAQRQVAVKVALAHGKRSGADRESLLHEARVVAQLTHPHIVKVLDLGALPDDRIYLVYEYIAGSTLSLSVAEGDYSRDEAVEWCAQIAEALHFAHRRGVVHRDVKPANILINAGRHALLADFGLATRDEKYWMDDCGSVMGTFSYLSPEQASGRSHWSSPQSDIYSLGTVLYQLLTSRLPFQSSDTLELLEQIQRRPPTPPRVYDDAIDPQLEQACLRALEKEPGRRFATAGDMAVVLRRCQRKTSQRNWLTSNLAIAVIPLAVLAAGLVSWSIWRESSPSTAVTTSQATSSLIAPSLEIYVQRQDENAGSTPLTEQSAPLRNGDKILLHGTLPKAAFAYLYWFDTHGNPNRLWPADLSVQQPTSEIYSPAVGAQDAQEVHVVGGEPGTQLAVLGLSERPMAESKLRQIETAAPDLKVAGAKITRLLQRQFPPDSSGQQRSLEGTVETVFSPLSPKFESVLESHFTSYTILLVPHR